MKKFAKMSLVAAVAVAGFTTAQAKDLSEAIKDVDVSGTVVYRYNDYGNGDATQDTDNYYKIGMSLSSKVNDDVKANTRFLVTNDSGNGLTGLDTGDGADGQVDVVLSQVNFQYTGLKNTSVFVGKQGLPTPWTSAIDSDGDEHTGTGILALSTWGPVTFAAGGFNQTNVDEASVEVNGASVALPGNKDLLTAGIIGSMGPVSAEAWVLDIADTADAYFVKAGASFDVAGAALKVYAQYNDMDIEDAVLAANASTGRDDHSLLKTGISAKMGLFDAAFTYGKTGDNGTGVAYSLTKVGMIGWNASLDDHYDADMYQVDLGMKVTPELHIGLNYDTIDTNDTVNADETDMFVQGTYYMSKNLMTYIRFGNYEQEGQTPDLDGTRGRLQVQYSF